MKILILALSFFLFPAGLQAAPAKPQVVKNPYADQYEVLNSQTRSKTPMVTEMYSVYCGACFMWEQKILPELKAKLAVKKIPFKQGHVAFMGKYGQQATTALAIAQHTGNYDALKQAMFERIHKQRNAWVSDADFFATLKAHGLTEKNYNLQKNNMFVLKILSDWSEIETSFQAVPSFIVNNKYLIKTQGLKSNDQFIELIEYLTKQP